MSSVRLNSHQTLKYWRSELMRIAKQQEDEDPEWDKYPRFKHSDDITSFLLEFAGNKNISRAIFI